LGCNDLLTKTLRDIPKKDGKDLKSSQNSYKSYVLNQESSLATHQTTGSVKKLHPKYLPKKNLKLQGATSTGALGVELSNQNLRISLNHVQSALKNKKNSERPSSGTSRRLSQTQLNSSLGQKKPKKKPSLEHSEVLSVNQQRKLKQSSGQFEVEASMPEDEYGKKQQPTVVNTINNQIEQVNIQYVCDHHGMAASSLLQTQTSP